jgi:hypothetical protein
MTGFGDGEGDLSGDWSFRVAGPVGYDGLYMCWVSDVRQLCCRFVV